MDSRRKKVLCPLKRNDGKTYWMRIGSAFTNSDGSTNIYLDALPSNSRLQIRELDDRDVRRADHESGGVEQEMSEVPF